MWLGRIVVPRHRSLGNAADHRRSPRVATEKPVSHGSFHLKESIVTGYLIVKPCLGNGCRSQIIGTPEIWDTVKERIIFSIFHKYSQPYLHKTLIFCRNLLIQAHRQKRMSQIDKRIVLVVMVFISKPVKRHPWAERLKVTPIVGLFLPVESSISKRVKGGGCKFDIIDKTVFRIEIWRYKARCLGISQILKCKIVC